jgi:hypothetical protein
MIACTSTTVQLMSDHYYHPMPVLEEITLPSLELDLRAAQMRVATVR